MTRHSTATWRRAAQASALALACVLIPAGPALADPATDDTSITSTASYVESVEKVNDRQVVLNVYSASMDEVFPVQVILPADTSEPRPVLYLLNGAGGGEDSATWQRQTDILDFFSDKNVNVVTPVGGAWSYYTDWQQDDPVLGRNKWQTFLNEELPPLIEEELGTNDKRALAAISMSATSVFNLAIAKPGFYTAVAAYSGCAQSSDPIGQQFIRTTVETWGGADSVENMWGPLDGPGWVENDPYVNAEKLRGTKIYMSSGNGLPSYPNDSLDNPRMQDGRASLPDQLIIGGPIEAATNYCTANMARRLAELGIPAEVDFRDRGTHSWGYWQDDIHRSWPFLAEALEL
ncbi:alpha/beta hydrolase [Rhodococcus yananensis]|uniref:alpha/beta hydrolase n=1 Tax=Rhodococcus yananensis TaxID=2879464 RepID=UPI001CF8492F|nr:alpha/beta hydrolase family protein [Rhodococcus yananensis]